MEAVALGLRPDGSWCHSVGKGEPECQRGLARTAIGARTARKTAMKDECILNYEWKEEAIDGR